MSFTYTQVLNRAISFQLKRNDQFCDSLLLKNQIFHYGQYSLIDSKWLNFKRFFQKSNSKNDYKPALPKTRPDDPSRAGKLTKTQPESFTFFTKTDYKTFSAGLKTLTFKQII